MINMGRGHLREGNIPTIAQNINPPPFQDFLKMTK